MHLTVRKVFKKTKKPNKTPNKANKIKQMP